MKKKIKSHIYVNNADYRVNNSRGMDRTASSSSHSRSLNTSERSERSVSSATIAKCRCKCGGCCCRQRRPHHSHDPHRRHRKSSAHKSKKKKRRSSYDSIHQYPERQRSEARESSGGGGGGGKSSKSKMSSSFSLGSRSSVESPVSLRHCPQTYKHNRMHVAESMKQRVIGPQTAGIVEQMLSPTQFLLYYRRADAIRSVDDVPICEPLMMAYKSSENEVAHYRVRYTYRDGKKFWRIDLGPGAERQHDFYSLDRLIQYYRDYMLLSGDIF